jgi:hypothetical protein
MSFVDWSRSLILCDGSILSLLACGAAREAVAAGLVKDTADEFPRAMLYGASTRAHIDAAERQSELFSVPLTSGELFTPAPGMSPGEAEAHRLLAVAYAAATSGRERVVWPVTGAAADSLNLDRIAEINDRALLAARLAALDARHHGAPGLRIEVPYADLTDRQVADLVLDLDLPVELCWWWKGEGSAEADRERRRWLSALEAVGWSRSGAGR